MRLRAQDLASQLTNVSVSGAPAASTQSSEEAELAALGMDMASFPSAPVSQVPLPSRRPPPPPHPFPVPCPAPNTPVPVPAPVSFVRVPTASPCN